MFSLTEQEKIENLYTLLKLKLENAELLDKCWKVYFNNKAVTLNAFYMFAETLLYNYTIDKIAYATIRKCLDTVDTYELQIVKAGKFKIYTLSFNHLLTVLSKLPCDVIELQKECDYEK